MENKIYGFRQHPDESTFEKLEEYQMSGYAAIMSPTMDEGAMHDAWIDMRRREMDERGYTGDPVCAFIVVLTN